MRGALLAVAIEASVSVLGEGLAVRRGQKHVRRALTNGGKKVGIADIGGGIGAGVAFGVLAVGGGPALTAAAPVLGLFALGHYGSRIARAIRPREESDSEPERPEAPSKVANRIRRGYVIA
jgi:hypothetical protein